MKKILTLSALAIALMASCTKNNVDDNNPSSNRLVKFSPYLGKDTKAVSTTDATFNTFVAYGYQGADASAAIDWNTTPKTLVNAVNVTKNGAKWETDKIILWPAEGTKTEFYGYSPADKATYSVTASKMPSLSFTAKTDIAEQTDLLVGTSGEVVAPEKLTPKAVGMTFKHALSKISVKAMVSNDQKAYISSIELGNLGSAANYTYTQTAGAWAAATTPINFPIKLNGSANNLVATTATDLTATDGAALVIPQTTTAIIKDKPVAEQAGKSYIKITYSLQNTSNNEWIVGKGEAANLQQVAYIPVAFNFAINTAYLYTIKLGTGNGGITPDGKPVVDDKNMITFTVNTLTDWENGTTNGNLEL